MLRWRGRNWHLPVCYLLLPALLWLGASGPAAQSKDALGGVHGTVIDAAGAPMPHTALTITNDSSGFERQIKSDGEGRFAFGLLPTGTYTLLADVPGFSQVRLTGIPVTAGMNHSLQVQFSSPKVSSSVVEVNLIFIAMNRWGHFVRGLRPSDLQVLDNGQTPARITHFEDRTNLPLDIALVIDTSDSMRRQFKTELSAGTMFLKSTLKTAPDKAMVVGFNQDVMLAQALSNDRKLLSKGLHQLTPGGNTALFDAIAFASKKLADLRNDYLVRRVVVLISDGEDNNSHIDVEQSVQAAERAGVIIFALDTNLDTNNDAKSMEESGDKVMRRLAEATGGRIFPAETEEQLRIAFHDIRDAIRHQYVIGYSPASTIAGFHQVKLVGPKGLHIHCREGYYANGP